jgi:hypothetical protein
MKTLLLLLMIVPLSMKGQTYDTSKVIMLVCDTTLITQIEGSNFNTNYYSLNINGNKTPVNRVAFVWWQFGYSVRELHNTSEGVMDAGGVICVDGSGKQIPCYTDYWLHLYYLDENKKPLPTTIVVWDTKPLTNKH